MNDAQPSALDDIRAALPEVARDIKLNLQAVLRETTLSAPQKWGVAVASAAAARNERLRAAVIADALREVDAAVVEDALAAAALMAMNNVYYRFRHLVGKEGYAQKPARLRMNRMVKPAGSRVDFELFSLAVSAINGCGACMSAHEQVVTVGGLTEDQVHDAVRIAATVNAAAVALEISASWPPFTETGPAMSAI
ncbi:MAG: carboxymuconolactone decarboxylase family protein [Polyangia bacterium]